MSRITFAARSDAGQMRGDAQRALGMKIHHDAVRAIASRAVGAVGYQHELRRKGCEAVDRRPQAGLIGWIARRKELERDFGCWHPLNLSASLPSLPRLRGG